MSDDFDPYQKWLDIPPQEQPPNHYRLLTLKPFEADGDVIRRTSAKLVAYLENRAKGRNAEHAARLLEEVAAARACLLDEQSKAEYDAGLKASTRETVNVVAAQETVRADKQQSAAPVAAKAVATKAVAAKAVAAKASNGRQSAAAAAPAVDVDDLPTIAPLDEAPIDDMSFLDGIHASGPGPSAADFGSAPLGMPAAKTAAKAPAASLGKGKFGAPVPTGKSGAKAGLGASGKNGKWQPQPWQIGAMIGGGALVLIVAVIAIVASQSTAEPEKPKNTPTPQAQEKYQFGPGTVDTAKMQEELEAKRKLPVGRASVFVPITRQGDFFLTDVKINGQPAGTFLIDTGAAATAITSEVADRLNLPDGDKPQGVRAVGGGQKASFRQTNTFHIGDAKFSGMQLIVIDLKPWQKAVGAKFDGVIGCDVLREMMFCIDPEQKKLTFYDRDKKNPISDKAEFLSVMDDRPFLTVQIDGGQEVQYMAATGCGHPLMQMPKREPGEAADKGPVTAEGGPQKVDSIKLLGQTFEGLTGVVGRSDDVYITSDPRQAGVVGANVLAQYKLCMDFQRNKVAAVRIKAK